MQGDEADTGAVSTPSGSSLNIAGKEHMRRGAGSEHLYTCFQPGSFANANSKSTLLILLWVLLRYRTSSVCKGAAIYASHFVGVTRLCAQWLVVQDEGRGKVQEDGEVP
jgi:hypothetical protein